MKGLHQLLQAVPDARISQWVERPLDMDAFVKLMKKLIKVRETRASGKSILIVDDDPTYLKLIKEWLKVNYRVSMANSGMQAITWLAKNRADLILLDYEMPITSGPQVLEMIKSDAATSDIPVIFLTGKGDKESIMKVLSLKPAGYLLKSIDRNGLRENLANHFASRIGKSL